MQYMQEEGNLAAKAIYEKCVPAFFYRPQENDCMWVFMITRSVNNALSRPNCGGSERGRWLSGVDMEVNIVWILSIQMRLCFPLSFSVLRDQWIRAKYKRREFTGENLSQTYSLGDWHYCTLPGSSVLCVFLCTHCPWLCVSHTRPVWTNALEKGQREQEFSEEGIPALPQRLHPQIFHQRGCKVEFCSLKCFWCASHSTKVFFLNSLMNCSLRLPKLSSQWRT